MHSGALSERKGALLAIPASPRYFGHNIFVLRHLEASRASIKYTATILVLGNHAGLPKVSSGHEQSKVRFSHIKIHI